MKLHFFDQTVQITSQWFIDICGLYYSSTQLAKTHLRVVATKTCSDAAVVTVNMVWFSSTNTTVNEDVTG